MASRSLNLVQIIGNLTRDPELRYTPNGVAVCTFGVATNRTWTPPDGGEQREEVEYHNIVSWRKLADLCNQLLRKGRKVYVSGRLQTRQWETPDGQRRERTEIVADQMILLDSRFSSGNEYQTPPPVHPTPLSTDRTPSAPTEVLPPPPDAGGLPQKEEVKEKKVSKEKKRAEKKDEAGDKNADDDIAAEDIPF